MLTIRSRVARAPDALGVVSLLAVLCAFATGCDTHSRFLPDTPPALTLTSGPIDTVSSPQAWNVDIAWTASDPDDAIDHYEYAIDPPGAFRARFAQAETSWVKTKENHVR